MDLRPALRILVMVAALASCGTGDGTSASPVTAAPFDYWVLALSWSPEYCASKDARPDSNQCTRPREFIVHGLWPQFERGYPASCDTGTRVSQATADRLAPLVPDRGLVFHQWRKHGSCSGMGPDDYFATLERAGRGITVPSAWLREASRERAVRREDVEQAFIESNPGLSGDAIAVDCHRDYLREIRVCLDLSLAPRPCGADVPDACPGTVRVRPVSS
ncbi:MAG: ribonuclease T2 family protein [Panacagrimonas sp.]